jgi:pimeloyl-ACP methyl ester carboxylesterase
MLGARENVLRLSDRHRLGYLECGQLDGEPVFYCHGFPGSRLEVRLAETVAMAKGIRLIGIDRPGYGLSDADPGCLLADWGTVPARLADALGIDRFRVLGVSGGGPYALACAHRLPDRVTGATVVCSLAPVDHPRALSGMAWFNRFGLRLSGIAPRLVPVALKPLAHLLRRHPGTILKYVALRAGEVDRRAMAAAEVQRLMRRTFRESVRSGTAGAARDVLAYSRPWGFRLSDIAVPVHLWHGEEDRIVPPAMGRRLAADMPQCRATFFPGEGHISLLTRRMEEIVSRLTAQ